jgi:hypothetical protein
MPEQNDRLRAIDPDALALEVGRALVRHYGEHALALGPGLQLGVDGGAVFEEVPGGGSRVRRLEADPACVGVALTVGDLCRFAQLGYTADWGGPEGALDAAQSVVAALYDAPADLLPTNDPVPWTERIEGDSDLAIVLRAALARVWVETGLQDVPATWLADLAGLSRGSLAKPLADGELAQEIRQVGRVRVAFIDHAYARAWLVGRGILASRPPSKKNRRGVE